MYLHQGFSNSSSRGVDDSDSRWGLQKKLEWEKKKRHFRSSGFTLETNQRRNQEQWEVWQERNSHLNPQNEMWLFEWVHNFPCAGAKVAAVVLFNLCDLLVVYSVSTQMLMDLVWRSTSADRLASFPPEIGSLWRKEREKTPPKHNKNQATLFQSRLLDAHVPRRRAANLPACGELKDPPNLHVFWFTARLALWELFVFLLGSLRVAYSSLFFYCPPIYLRSNFSLPSKCNLISEPPPLSHDSNQISAFARYVSLLRRLEPPAFSLLLIYSHFMLLFWHFFGGI